MIDLFASDGFTIDGTGYYARHLESHRLLYGRRWTCAVVLNYVVLLGAPIVAFVGVASNRPAMATFAVFALGLAAWYFQKKGRRFRRPTFRLLTRFVRSS